MPTKNEPRLSLVTDREEITAVKAPPPGLIRESKVVAVPGPGPVAARARDDGAVTPPVVVTSSSPAPTMVSSRGSGRVVTARVTPATGRPISATLSLPQPPLPPAAAATTPAARPFVARSTPAQPGARVPTPVAPAPALGHRSTPAQPGARVPTPVAPTPALGRVATPMAIPATLIAFYQRSVVDLVPVSPGVGAITFAAPALFPSPARSRAGLYAILIALLAGGAGLVGWRQWSARPGRVEITTTPADAIITVGNDVVAQRSPFTLERPAGSYEISVARDGYQHTRRTVDLAAGQEGELAIALAAASSAGGAPPVPVAAQAARPASGQPAVRHASATGAASGAAATPRRAPASTSAPVAQPDPGIAAMLARSHPLRDLSGAPSAEQAPPPATADPALEEPAPAPAAKVEEEAPAAPAPTANATPTPTPTAAASPTSPETTGARTVPGRVAKAQLAIDPNAAGYRVALPPSLARADMKLAAVVKVCVSAEGKVAAVKLLKSADPAVDPQIPLVLSRWRFRPLMANGRAVPFCYVTQYEISAP